MIEVDDQVADAERREFGEEGVGALAALLAADEAFAEHVLLGEQADRVGGEAMVEREDDQRGPAPACGRRGTQRLLPASACTSPVTPCSRSNPDKRSRAPPE